MTHETLEKYLALSPRIKVLILAGGVLLLIALIFGIFSIGEWWASGRFWKEREKLLKQAELHERAAETALENSRRLEIENEIMRVQNEKQAALLRQSDSARLQKEAETLADINQKFENKLSEIDSTDDAEQLAALCLDAKQAGIKFSFCEGK